MSAVTQVATLPRFPWRTAGLVALLVLALLAAALLVGSSRSRPVPAPFGPAGAGQVAFESGGDIFTANATTGATTAVVTGPEADSEPRWSLDGTMIAFRRQASVAASTLFVVDADGGNLRQVVSDPLPFVTSHQISPDGTLVAIAHDATGKGAITLAKTDGSGATTLDLPFAASDFSFRPPDGAELLLVTGIPRSGAGQGLATYDVATGRATELYPPQSLAEILRATYSPDGSRIAFGLYPSEDLARVYTMNADGTNVRRLDAPSAICCEAFPVWSNDGTRLAVSRWYDPAGSVVAIVPWETGGKGIEFEVENNYISLIEWSPDDRWLLVTTDRDGARGEQVRIDSTTGRAMPINWSSTSFPTIQRVAP